MIISEGYTREVWGFLMLLLNIFLAIYYLLIYTKVLNDQYIKQLTWLYVIFMLILSASRPIGKMGFADSQMYADWFLYAKEHAKPIHHRDIAFDYYQLLLSYVVNVRAFFVITSVLFLSLLLAIGKRINKEWYILVVPLFLCTEIYFGIMNVLLRNGIAMLLFILAILSKKTINKLILFILCILFHKSMVLPVLVYALLQKINIKIRHHLLFWLVAIPVSLIVGSQWYYLLETIAFDFRFDYLLKLTPHDYLYHQTGFRWDFLFVSAVVIIYGLYQIYIRNFKNSFYLLLFKLFISLNTVWILIMYANHTVRFFLLSWFLVPVLLGYPYLHTFHKNLQNHFIKLIVILVSFSILMYFKRFLF